MTNETTASKWWSTEMVMHYASVTGGLSGESRMFNYPASYYATHIVENDGWRLMNPTMAKRVAALLKKGWIERRETTRDYPEEPNMFGPGMHPAHTTTRATYFATEAGRQAK
jgi:hypothetical protein